MIFISTINNKIIFILYTLIIVFCFNVKADSSNLIKDLEGTGNHRIFISILERSPLFLSLINNSIEATIYAPTDAAFKKMPKEFMKQINNNNIKYTTKIILTHIFSGNNLNNNSDQGMVLSLDGSLYYTYEFGDLFVKDIVVKGNFFKSGYYSVIPVDCVMFLQQSSNDQRLDKKIQEKYLYTTCCLETEEEYSNFVRSLK